MLTLLFLAEAIGGWVEGWLGGTKSLRSIPRAVFPNFQDRIRLIN